MISRRKRTFLVRQALIGACDAPVKQALYQKENVMAVVAMKLFWLGLSLSRKILSLL